MDDRILDKLAGAYENVVLYAQDGTPGVFVKFPRMKSSDLDPSLPEHTHPAFIINGVEQDYILLGKYKCGMQYAFRYPYSESAMTSLPGIIPTAGLDEGAFLTGMRAFGGGVSGMTAADRGLLLLLAQKHGWKPGGNNGLGHCVRDAPVFYDGCPLDEATGTYLYNAGDRVGYDGWLYACLKEHERSRSIRPDKSASHWKRLRKIGGDHIDGMAYTANGSGPLSWYLDGMAGSVCDILGNLFEADYGYRVVGGELQILPDNDAASPEADLSETSTAWRAILPSQTDDSYTLVEPGTAGTLHWSYVWGEEDRRLVLDTSTPEDMTGLTIETPFSKLSYASSYRLPYVPCIVRELGLYPTAGSEMEGTVVLCCDRGILTCSRGCSEEGEYAEGMGMGQMWMSGSAHALNVHRGARQRAMAQE